MTAAAPRTPAAAMCNVARMPTVVASKPPRRLPSGATPSVSVWVTELTRPSNSGGAMRCGKLTPNTLSTITL
jgi:hypothetical protein